MTPNDKAKLFKKCRRFIEHSPLGYIVTGKDRPGIGKRTHDPPTYLCYFKGAVNSFCIYFDRLEASKPRAHSPLYADEPVDDMLTVPESRNALKGNLRRLGKFLQQSMDTGTLCCFRYLIRQ